MDVYVDLLTILDYTNLNQYTRKELVHHNVHFTFSVKTARNLLNAKTGNLKITFAAKGNVLHLPNQASLRRTSLSKE